MPKAVSAKTAEIRIAADGGGTKCRVALVTQGGRFEATGGPANVTSDPDGAVAAIRSCIDTAAGQAGFAPEALASARAYLALAGVLDAAHGQRIAAQFPFAKVAVGTDREAAVLGALGRVDGAVFGIGTGSFLGRQRDGAITLMGGWGLQLGDEASGAVIGRTALSRTLAAIEGHGACTALTQEVVAEYGGASGVIAFASTASPADFARLAPQVVSAAEAGDLVGRAIMAEGAAYIDAGLRHLGWQPGEPLCPIGGLAASYVGFLPDALANAVRDPEGTALDGALDLARALQ